MKYTLDEVGRPVAEPDINTWAQWFESADRGVARTTIGPIKISTVFLGIDHRFGDHGDPVLWETMVFDAPDGEERQERYTSKEEALEGHERITGEVHEMLKEYNI